MSYSPDSDITPDDVTRAAQYGAWAAQFKNTSAPDGLSEVGAWGHVARWLAQKGAKDFTMRATGVTAPDLLYHALIVEPSKHLGWPQGWLVTSENPLGPNARGNQRTLRGMLVWGINRSPDKMPESWSMNGTRLAEAMARAIETDPDAATRLEILRLLAQGSFPVQKWANIFLPALDRSQAVLAETSFDVTTRRALQKLLSEAKARLLALLATQGLPTLPGGDHLSPPVSGFPWKLVIGITAGVATAGLGVWQWRRHRLRLAPAPRRRALSAR